jgi:hypothetical protein
MNSDGDNIYIKIVAFDEISNFFHLKFLKAEKTIYYPDLNIWVTI